MAPLKWGATNVHPLEGVPDQRAAKRARRICSETAATAPSALMGGAAKCPSRFQIIMASDIVYDEAHTALIWRTVAALLSNDKHAMFVSTAYRRILRFFFDLTVMLPIFQ